jgi:hypothetical protein
VFQEASQFIRPLFPRPGSIASGKRDRRLHSNLTSHYSPDPTSSSKQSCCDAANSALLNMSSQISLVSDSCDLSKLRQGPRTTNPEHASPFAPAPEGINDRRLAQLDADLRLGFPKRIRILTLAPTASLSSNHLTTLEIDVVDLSKDPPLAVCGLVLRLRS